MHISDAFHNLDMNRNYWPDETNKMREYLLSNLKNDIAYCHEFFSDLPEEYHKLEREKDSSYKTHEHIVEINEHGLHRALEHIERIVHALRSIKAYKRNYPFA